MAVLAAILLLALNLRSAVTSLGPLLGDLDGQLHLGGVTLSLLAGLPPVLFGLAGLGTPATVRRIGHERAAAGAMALAAVGLAARAIAPGAWAFFACQLVALVGMGMGNVLLPPLVKRHFPHRLGVLTALYGIGLQLGTALPALTVVPVADRLGWRAGLGIWSGFAVVAMLPWLCLAGRTGAPRLETEARSAAVPLSALLRSRVAWGGAALLGTTSLNTYSVYAWLPTVLAEAGTSRADAGSLLGLYALMSIPLALTVPWAAARLRNPFVVSLFGVACYLAGYGGLVLAPGRAPLLWTVLVGVAATGFPLALCLVALRTVTSAGAVALSGFVQGVGYLIAATGPIVTGLLHGTTGGWTAPFVFLALTLLPMMAGSATFCRPTMLEATLPEGPEGLASGRPHTDVPTAPEMEGGR
ncbi:MFS transporter [Intrasporangium chromatireducens]|uniref:MFS transporter n=1 Tax=Intrasporangium chromatireducens TaxID=1386088 RepID=UPI0004B5F7B1|nr:MFS transporter [Intrasporangium chromatireducens]